MQTLPIIGPILRDTPAIHNIVNTLSNSNGPSWAGLASGINKADKSYNNSKKFEV